MYNRHTPKRYMCHMYLSVCLPACLPACLSVCLSVCLPACLSVWLSPSLSLFFPSFFPPLSLFAVWCAIRSSCSSVSLSVSHRTCYSVNYNYGCASVSQSAYPFVDRCLADFVLCLSVPLFLSVCVFLNVSLSFSLSYSSSTICVKCCYVLVRLRFPLFIGA